MGEDGADDCADNCPSDDSCRRDMHVVWWWRWAWSGNGNWRRRRNGCSVNHMLYDARRLIDYHDTSSTAIRVAITSCVVGLCRAVAVVMVLPGGYAVHVVTAHIASMVDAALGVSLTATIVLILAAPCARLSDNGCRAEHESCQEGKNCSLHNRSIFYEPRLGEFFCCKDRGKKRAAHR